jgi:integrase
MGIRSGDHLRWRDGWAHYRRGVPADCRTAFGCWEWSKSLDTRDRTEAKEREKEIDIEFVRSVKAVREARDPRAVAAHVIGGFRLSDAGRLFRGGLGVSGRLAGFSTDDQQIARQIIGDYGGKLGAQQDVLLSMFREIGDLFSKAVAPELLQQFRDTITAIARHQVGKATEPPGPTVVILPDFCAFRTILTKWSDEQKPAPKTVYSWKRILRKLVACVKSVPTVTEDELFGWNAASLTETDVIGWKDALVAAKLSTTTIRNHLTILRTIYNYAGANKLVPAAVAEGVRRVRYTAKRKPGTKPLGYTDGEAISILTAARRERDPVLRWSPWVAASTGARIDEICGAGVADIMRDAGIYWFRIALDNRDENAEIKTENAERMAPLPAGLIEEGFLEYVDGLPKGGPLFPDLKPDMFGRRGGNGSKRLARWVRAKVNITDKRKKPSHSWRHRYRTIVRNPTHGIGEDVADYMVGHGGSGGEGRSYGEYRDAMVVAIGKLPHPLPEHLGQSG